MSFVLNKTRIGRYTIAIGSNKEALKLSGVNVLKWHILAYMVCGLFTGLAAVTYAATFSNITPGQGAGFELNAIGAAIIGGTAMTGGSGSVFGTFLGVLLISLLQVGLPFVGLNADWQLLITGCILMGIFCFFPADAEGGLEGDRKALQQFKCCIRMDVHII